LPIFLRWFNGSRGFKQMIAAAAESGIMGQGKRIGYWALGTRHWSSGVWTSPLALWKLTIPCMLHLQDGAY
jgi:hypothetical protein